MSELTTEDLQAMKEFCGKSHLPILKELAVQAFDELLSLRTDAGDDLKSGNDFLRQEIEDWKEANRRAEAERDEARKEVEKWVATVGNASRLVDSLTAELAALKSCPEMGEVDAIEDWLEGKEIEFGVVRRIKRLVEMVGQLSAALTEERKRGDEVAGLLRWWVEFKDGFGQLEGISVGSAVNEWKENARRILAICGKEVGT